MNAPFVTPAKKPKGTKDKTAKIEALLILEAKVREVTTLAELQYLIANETRKLIPCRQILVHRGCPLRAGWRIEKISSVGQIDRNAPMVKYLHGEIKKSLKKDSCSKGDFTPINFVKDASGKNYPFKRGFYFPLADRNGINLGGISLLTEGSLSQRDIVLASRLTSTYAHAWAALKPASKTSLTILSKRNFLIAALLTFLAGFIPVPLTVLAPTEVVAQNAFIIAAPIQGVIEEVHVSPNMQVKKGQLLVSYNALDLKNRDDIATRNMAIARARFQRASQSAFGHGDGRRELAITKAEYELAAEEKRFAVEQLALVELRASNDGVVLFSNRDDWVGKPVVVGERIMRVANPENTEFKIKLAVGDSIILGHEATARIFLDSDPLTPIKAKIAVKSYTAEKSGDEPLAFPVTARTYDDQKPKNLRIGLRGTAQLSGENVPLAFNLFRKPLSAIRQYLGL